MPLIPKLTAGGVSKVVPAADVITGAGRTGQALSNLGTQISNISNNILEKTIETEAKSYASQRKVDDFLAVDEFKKQAAIDYADNPDEYNAKVKGFISTAYKKAQDEAPSGLAQQMYVGAAKNTFINEQLNADAFTVKQKFENFKAGDAKLQNKIAGFAYDNSDFVGLNDLVKTKEQLVNSETALTASQKEEINQKFRDRVARDYFSGRLDNDQIAIARAVIRDEKNPITAGMTPELKSKIVRAIDRASEQTKVVKSRELEIQVKAARSLMKSGITPNVNLDELEQGIANSGADPVTIKRELAGFVADRAVYEEVKAISNLPRSEWTGNMDAVAAAVDKKVAALGGGDVVTQAITESAKASFVTAMSQVRQEQDKDSVAWIQKTNPKVAELEAVAFDPKISGPEKEQAISNYVTRLDAERSRLGIPDNRILSSAKAVSIAGQLNSAVNPDAKATTVWRLKDEFGRYSSRVFGELIDNNKVDPAIVLAANARDPLVASRIMNNAFQSKEKLGAFSAPDSGARADLTKAVKVALSEEIAMMSRGDSRGLKAPVINALVDNISVDVATRLAASGSTNMRAQIESSVNAIIGGNIVNGGNSQTLMPFRSENNLVSARTFFRESVRPENFKTFDVAIGKQTMAILKERHPDMSDSQLVDRQMADYAGNSFWAQTNDFNSVQLFYQNPKDPTDVIALKDSKGILIQFNYEDMKNVDFVQDVKNLAVPPDFERRRSLGVGPGARNI